jgi:anti-sigma factor RsiW
MSEPTTTDPHEAFLVDFDEWRDGSLAPARRAELDAHLAACPSCRAEFDKLRDAVEALSGLHRVKAPQLGDQVAATIHRRSGGRFFGRRTFGDRVPFVAIAVLGLLLALAAVWLFRGGGDDGPRHKPPPPPPGTVVPRPL